MCIKLENADQINIQSAFHKHGGQAKVAHATDLESVRMLVTSFVGSTPATTEFSHNKSYANGFIILVFCYVKCNASDRSKYLFYINGEL